jgi:arylsulfatase A-like enzyme
MVKIELVISAQRDLSQHKSFHFDDLPPKKNGRPMNTNDSPNNSPNILFIMTDQHRPDHTGFGGNGIVQTPHVDALATKSTRFDRAHVANPICMPNRSSIFTSRMPSLHGTRYNGIALDWRVETFPRILKRAGYHTAHLGKCHLQNMNIMASVAKRQTDKMNPGDAIDLSYYPKGWDD